MSESEALDNIEELGRKLKGKQKPWADAFLTNGENKTQACRDAKYKGNDAYFSSTGSQNYGKPCVRAYIDAVKALDAEKNKITRESLIQNIKDIMENAQKVEQHSVCMKGVEQMAKMMGLNEPEKIDITTKGDKVSSIDMSTLSAETLKEIANAPQRSD